MTKQTRLIIFVTIFGGMLLLLGLHEVYGGSSDYEIKYNFREVGDWGADEKRVESVDLYIDGVKLNGVFKNAPNCVAGSKFSTSCDIIIIMQNERIIKLLEGLQ